MKLIILCLLACSLTGIISCTNGTSSGSINTTTPEDFGKSLLAICVSNDSAAYASLMVTEEDMMKFLEDSKEYKAAKPNAQLLVKTMLESTFENTQQHLKGSFHYVIRDFKHEGITDLSKAKVIKVESKDISRDNIYWVNTTFEIDGVTYVLRCEDVCVIPGKGFRMNKSFPSVYKIK